MDYEAGDVVIVPFRFTDRTASMRRPALVLSDRDRFSRETGQLLLAMIISAKQSAWPLDSGVTDVATAGLDAPCIVRMKLFTLDARLILRRAGALSGDDMTTVRTAIAALLG